MSAEPPSAKVATDRLLAALASRDMRAVEAALSPQCRWQNVPSPATEGRDAVVAMLGRVVNWSDRVQWDLLSAAYDGTSAWLERADRFWINGDEHTVLCNGVFECDPDSNTVLSVRDYVDLGEWRSRITPALEAMAQRSASDVLVRHLEAVVARDPVAMAADYARDAVLRRGDDEYRGWRAIAGYFDDVPNRLTGRNVNLARAREEYGDRDRSSTSTASVRWEITDRTSTVVASGTDRYVVAHGQIIEQVVTLDITDF